MACRKQVAVKEDQTAVIEEAAQQELATTTAVLEPPVDQAPVRQWRDNPYPVKTVNLGGTKLVLQESRPAKEKSEDRGRPSADDLWHATRKDTRCSLDPSICSRLTNSRPDCSYSANHDALGCRYEGQRMRVISKARLKEFREFPDHDDAGGPLRACYSHVNSKTVS